MQESAIECARAKQWVGGMEWLSNGWVIGIGSGVASGLIVLPISRYYFSAREQRELNQKIAAANREVVFAVRHGIPEGAVPSKEVVRSLVEATARRYGIDPDKMYGPAEISSDLIKEVMDSSFISADTKQEYCSKLIELQRGDVPTVKPPLVLVSSGLRETPALALALAASGMSLALAYQASRGGVLGDLSPVQLILIPSGVSLIAGAVAAFLIRLRTQRNRLRLSSSHAVFANSIFQQRRELSTHPKIETGKGRDGV